MSLFFLMAILNIYYILIDSHHKSFIHLFINYFKNFVFILFFLSLIYLFLGRMQHYNESDIDAMSVRLNKSGHIRWQKKYGVSNFPHLFEVFTRHSKILIFFITGNLLEEGLVFQRNSSNLFLVHRIKKISSQKTKSTSFPFLMTRHRQPKF
jgi:hypothetical protein